MQITLELASEAPGYAAYYPSDVHFSLNGKELGVYLSKGEYNDRTGTVSPSWWYGNLGQYGKKVTLFVNREGTYLDGVKVSETKLDDLGIAAGEQLRFRILYPKTPNTAADLPCSARDSATTTRESSARLSANKGEGTWISGRFPHGSGSMRSGKGKGASLLSSDRCADGASCLSRTRRQRGFCRPLPKERRNAAACGTLVLPSPEPVADEGAVRAVSDGAEGYDYLLAVGAGTLNDLCKYAGSLTHKPSGVGHTAASMDGFIGVTPLIENGFKITRPAQTVSDILMDFDVLCAAPRMMTGAGRGGYPGKILCAHRLAVSSALTGEAVNEEAFSLMYDAVRACDDALPALGRGEPAGVEKLMDALRLGPRHGDRGNSRPASGAGAPI